MKTYLDTSALLKLYYPELETKKLTDWTTNHKSPLIFSSLHELELKNAMLQKLFRCEIKKTEFQKLHSILEADLESGVLLRSVHSWNAMFSKAILIAEKCTEKLGSRSLDILHVALALSLGCTHFLSFDQRQIKTAKKMRLKIISL